MFSWIRNWKPKHLAMSWAAYWVALSSTLWTPIALARHLTTLPDGHGSFTFGFQNTLLYLTMMEDGRPVYSGSIHLVTLLLLIAGPPLLLWLAWLANRPPRDEVMASEGTAAIASRTRDGAAVPHALNPHNGGEIDMAPRARVQTPVPRSPERRD